MSSSREQTRRQLIDELSTTLEPSPTRLSPARIALAWLLASVVFVVLAFVTTGPFRWSFAPGPPTMVGTLELVVGLLVVALAAGAAFELSVPGPVSAWRRAWPALALTVVWLGLLGWRAYALDGGVEGSVRRSLCTFHGIGVLVPPFVLAMVLLARRAAFKPRPALALFGLAGGMLVAIALHLGCCASPMHAFKHHVLPALGVSILPALLAGRLVAPRR
ncbi:MAG: NrsF family protein [Acidobacteriota bacterium]